MTHRRSNRAGSPGLLFVVAATIGACTQAAGLDGTYALANPPCDTNADCASGTCAGIGGWCTASCASDVDCAPGLCVQSKGGANLCFPSCASPDDCSIYGATGITCQPTVSIDQAGGSICSESD